LSSAIHQREELSNTPAFFGLTEMSNLSDAHRAMIERSTYMYFANKSTDEAGPRRSPLRV